MIGIEGATPVSDQPVGGVGNFGTIFGETKNLTDWVTVDNPDIQAKYAALTQGLNGIEDKIFACWEWVKFIPYTEHVITKMIIGGKSYVQKDAWLEPAQTLKAGTLNCMNKSILLASLLRQELPPSQIYVCLNNVKNDGIGGHAICYLQLGEGYILETTNPNIISPFILASKASNYDSVAFMNDAGVWWVENRELKLPLGLCCIRWMEDYINSLYCTEWK